MKTLVIIIKMAFLWIGFENLNGKGLSNEDILLEKRERAFKKAEQELPFQGPTLEDQIKDSFFDPNFNYTEFTGRVTDRDKSASILKVSSESGNIKFFRSGDEVRFRLAGHATKSCIGYVRSVEEDYFVLYVKDISPCWGEYEYIMGGAMLVFDSEQLSARVVDASNFRIILLKRRRDYLKQLNDINHFVWSFDQERIKMASEFDEKITALRQAKTKALDMLHVKKEDSIKLQRELAYRLDKLDKDLEFYRIDKDEPKIDRWHLDHDLGVPVSKRPVELKYRDE
jgi:hypothetical protein